MPGSARASIGDGDELRTHSIVRDLTPEREWEAALRLSRERFQRFFANAPIGIALIDRFGRLEEANRALGELFGVVDRAILIGQPLIGFVNEDDRRELAVKLAGAADGSAPPGPIEVRIKGLRDKTCVLFLGRLDGVEGGDGGADAAFHRRHRAEEPRSPVRPVAEDAGGRPVGRRRRARFQQSADRDDRLLRPAC